MAWSDTGRKSSAGSTSGSTTNITLNSTAAGSMIVVGVSAWASSGAPTITVSDNVNGSYGTAIFTVSAGDQRGALFVFPNNAGGNLTITVTASASGWRGCFAHEFAGGDTSSPQSGSTSTASGNDATGSISPPDDDVLAVAVLGLNRTGGITENDASEGFTLSNEFEDPPGNGQPGSMVFKLFSGDPGSVSHSWATNSASDGACGIAAFKPGATDPVYEQSDYRFYANDGTGLGEAA